MSMCVVFFFVKQKTAYDMRISDCSSDVCSSDLQAHVDTVCARHFVTEHAVCSVLSIGATLRSSQKRRQIHRMDGKCRVLRVEKPGVRLGGGNRKRNRLRSEARRVGKEGDRTWRSRWSPKHEKKNTKKNRH